ncbi:MAG: ECF transporter S component [Treponema sp.]|nr:ECF transporter S component [Treponema sp.]
MSLIAITRKERKPVSAQLQSIATILAIVAAVVVPQVFHQIGVISGAGKAPGVAFSPMHLPIIIVGLLAGPYAGAIAGLGGPVAAFALSGMPTAAQLPFMMVELLGYGLTAGLLRQERLPLLLKVVVAQVMGRVLRMVAVFVAFYILGDTHQQLFRVWTSIPASLPGIVLQWTCIPLFVYWIENQKRS